jgi:hypothetical protein
MLETVIDPMIAKLSAVCDVHVMLPPIWLEKYSEAENAPSSAWRRDVAWHRIDDHRDLDAMDTAGPSTNALALARAIGPDYCLCRSTNTALPARLPGKVSFIMEASAPPFTVPKHWITLQPQIFDHGLIPDLSVRERGALRDLILPAWTKVDASHAYDPSWRARNGLPADRKIVALPLEYDHPDNLFSVHRSVRPNHLLVAGLADRMPGPLFLAVTDHPLNEKFVDNRDLLQTLEHRKETARLLPSNGVAGGITPYLARHADGMIVGDSKSFAAAAFFATPILRISKFASGPWLGVYEDFDQFATALASGTCRAADRDDAIVWFAFYLANQAFAPGDAEVDGAEILSRIETQVDPGRWRAAFERHERARAA